MKNDEERKVKRPTATSQDFQSATGFAPLGSYPLEAYLRTLEVTLPRMNALHTPRLGPWPLKSLGQEANRSRFQAIFGPNRS